jgi:hypothetical protein
MLSSRTILQWCSGLSFSTSAQQSEKYCDAVALEFRSKTIFLCEFTYAANPGGLIKRLKGWNEHWDKVRNALARDSLLFESWPVRPWLFVPQEFVSLLVKRLDNVGNGQPLKFVPRITPLEMAQPWKFRGNRIGESDKPEVPEEMRT